MNLLGIQLFEFTQIQFCGQNLAQNLVVIGPIWPNLYLKKWKLHIFIGHWVLETLNRSCIQKWILDHQYLFLAQYLAKICQLWPNLDLQGMRLHIHIRQVFVIGSHHGILCK